jgi:hypothetical protein
MVKLKYDGFGPEYHEFQFLFAPHMWVYMLVLPTADGHLYLRKSGVGWRRAEDGAAASEVDYLDEYDQGLVVEALMAVPVVAWRKMNACFGPEPALDLVAKRGVKNLVVATLIADGMTVADAIEAARLV